MALPVSETKGLSAADIVPLTGAPGDYDRLLDLIGDRRFVLLGEASHGSHEFYQERARITQRLIEEKDFTAVAVEADWPDAYRVNRYVLGTSDDRDAVAALADFSCRSAGMAIMPALASGPPVPHNLAHCATYSLSPGIAPTCAFLT